MSPDLKGNVIIIKNNKYKKAKTAVIDPVHGKV
jgi:hypothetical protein